MKSKMNEFQTRMQEQQQQQAAACPEPVKQPLTPKEGDYIEFEEVSNKIQGARYKRKNLISEIIHPTSDLTPPLSSPTSNELFADPVVGPIQYY
jgi:hypothetical protein